MSGAVVTQLAGLESKYRPYPEYKDSGVEWLDCLPMDWGKTTLKMLIDVRDGTHDTPSYVEVSEDSFPIVTSKDVTGGKIDLTNCKHISKEDYEAIIKRSAVSEGDILMPMIGTVGFPILVTGHSNFAIKNLALFKTSERSDLISTVFLLYFLNSNECSLQFSLESRGGVQNFVSLGTLRNLGLPLVPFKEQQKIVDFLDHETARIDRLIAQQQRLIELLKEKRQAVISHAVTKGLNPNAPMKDSGVEWLGQVPEHWVRIKLKHITHKIVDAEHKTAPYFDDGQYLVCRTTNVRDGKLRLEGGKYTDRITYEEWTKRGEPEIGDILFTREAPAGEACVYSGEYPLCLGQRMVLFKLDKLKVSPEFVLFSIYSGLADDFVKQLSQGSTVTHFNMADIQNIPLFEPLLDEQIQIVQELSKILTKLDHLTSSANKAIGLMQERRTALISAAVTGKIDLRGWRPPVKDAA